MPAKTAFEGGNICNYTRQRVDLDQLDVSQFTTPTPLPRAAEKAYKTFTVGSSHFVNFSSAQ